MQGDARRGHGSAGKRARDAVLEGLRHAAARKEHAVFGGLDRVVNERKVPAGIGVCNCSAVGVAA